MLGRYAGGLLQCGVFQPALLAACRAVLARACFRLQAAVEGTECAAAAAVAPCLFQLGAFGTGLVCRGWKRNRFNAYFKILEIYTV